MRQLLIKNKNYRNYWLACSITTIGDYVDDIALVQLIYFITNSTLITSYVFAIKIVLTFLSIFTATFVDKWNKKNIIIWTSFGQGILLLAILVLYHYQQLNTWILIVFVTIQTFFSTFSTPAQNAIIPCIVTEKEMLNARTALSIFMQFIQIFAYVCAGALISWIGIKGAILLDSLTFFISVFIMFMVNSNETNNQGFVSVHEFFGNVKEGFVFVLSEKVIFTIMLVAFLGNMLVSPVDSLMPAYFTQGKFQAYAYSIFMVGIASGGIIGSWGLTKIQNKFEKSSLLALGFCFGALGMMLLYFDHGLMPYIASLFIGSSFGFVSILNATILQLRTPKEMTARTFSIFKCLSFIASPLGIVLAGAFGEYVQMKIVFLPFGFSLLVTSLLTVKMIAPIKK